MTVTQTQESLDASVLEQAKDRPLTEDGRTFVHELTHASQALGTTLGYYTWMLRATQADDVVRILRGLVEAGLPIKLPLIDYLPTLPGLEDRTLGDLHGWQLAEALISELAGTPAGLLHAGTQDPVLATTWQRRWTRLQSNIAELYETPDNRWPDAFFTALHAEEVVDVPDDVVAQVIALSAGSIFTVASVMESAALAVELSPSDDLGLEAAMAGAARASTVEEHDLYLLLARTRRAYPDLSTASLLATHLAACDVALNPPCLPIHLLDRGRLDFTELHPVARIVAVWQALGDGVRPAADIDDALRCADDLCTALGWTSVTDVLTRAAQNYSDHAADARGRAFASAMKARIAYPPLLHNPRVPLWGSGPLVDVYTAELTPAFWIFADAWSPGGEDHDRADRLLYDTLQVQWTRSIMLGRPAVLRVPVPLPQELRDHLAGALAHHLSAAVGKDLRPPVVDDP